MAEYIPDDVASADAAFPRGTTQPMPVLDRVDLGNPTSAAAMAAGRVALPSYRPTGIALADHILDIVDQFSGGKADWFQRLFSYLFIGGFAALVNLAVYGFFSNSLKSPFIVAELFAAEISIMANFIPNDRITFSHLPGHARSWWQRCVRFHMTSIAGTLVTIAVSGAIVAVAVAHGHQDTGIVKLGAQAIAILVALAFNFTFHHLFTYRHTGEVAH